MRLSAVVCPIASSVWPDQDSTICKLGSVMHVYMLQRAARVSECDTILIAMQRHSLMCKTKAQANLPASACKLIASHSSDTQPSAVWGCSIHAVVGQGSLAHVLHSSNCNVLQGCTARLPYCLACCCFLSCPAGPFAHGRKCTNSILPGRMAATVKAIHASRWACQQLPCEHHTDWYLIVAGYAWTITISNVIHLQNAAKE